MNSPSDKSFTKDLGKIERIQVEWFLSRFTQDYYSEYLFGHALLLAYAAVPAYLTPDLLYKMRQNFGRYQWGNREEFVHTLAVSDILLAPFCREVSFELFRMDENIRLALLRWMNSDDPLWTKCNPATIEQIARFLKHYHELPNDATVRHGSTYREEQDFEARLYYDSAEVAKEYLEKLRHATKDRDILMAINALLKAKAKEEALSIEEKHFNNLFTNYELEFWKDALQRNNDSLTDRVGQEVRNAEVKKLFDTISTNARAAKVTINKQETIAVRQMDAMMPAQKKAIYIGLSTADSNNCELMSRTIQNSHIDKWENHFFTKPISNRELETRLDEIISGCTRYDHLLVYISVADPKGPSTSKNKMIGSIPQVHQLIETLFKKSIAGGLTVIYDGLLEVRPDISAYLDDGKVLFVSPQSNQTIKKEKNSVSEFTNLVCQTISGYSILYTHRQLFSALVTAYQQRNSKSKNAEPLFNYPLLICNQTTYSYPFSRNLSARDKVQMGLRLTGYFHEPATTAMTEGYSKAIHLYATDNQIPPEDNQVLLSLTTTLEQQEKELRPLFVFVFSDPEKQLQTLEEEVREIAEAFRIPDAVAKVEIKIMHNRSLAEVDKYIRDEDVRNRIQLFYYSGMDQDGNPVFKDGIITVSTFDSWLSFHANMDVVVLNTCRAAPLAEQLTQMGVALAIGALDIVYDAYGTDFARMLIKGIQERSSFEALPFSSIEHKL